MSQRDEKTRHRAFLYFTSIVSFHLVSASFYEPLNHAINSLQAYQGHPTAVLAAGHTGNLLSYFHQNLTISSTLWTCEAVNSRCYQSFLRYITQSEAFPRPSFVFAPWQSGLPKGIFEDVRRLDVPHPYVYWVFAVRDHSDFDEFLSNHSCQVITISEKDVSMAADGYKSCGERVTRSTLEWKYLLGNQEAEGTYPRDGSITFALHEKKTTPPDCANMGPMFFLSMALSSVQVRAPEEAAVLDAYHTINNTVRMHCADRVSGETLLREKQIDFVLYSWFKNESTSVSEYKHAFYTPSSLCFYSRCGTPVPPSFSESWVFFFWCLVCLAPFCCTIAFIFHAKGVVCPNERVPLYAVVMVLVSSFLGRSPQGLNIAASATRLVISLWLLAMVFVGNYLQSSVTASRSVPQFSAEIRSEEQLLNRLNGETLAPCTARFNHEMRGDKETEPVYKPLARALRKCRSGCLDIFGFGCLEKASRRTHVYFATCTEMQRRVALRYGLVVGDNALAAWQAYSAVHIRYPFRYQHRRLMMAVSESGIWMHYGAHYPLPSANDDTVSFDMALNEYLGVLYVGLTLSLVAFLFEIFLHRCITKRAAVQECCL